MEFRLLAFPMDFDFLVEISLEATIVFGFIIITAL